MSNYLKLVQVGQTWFRWNENEHSVLDALPEVFHQWISQYVGEFRNVDLSLWPIHHRWNVINDCLKAEVIRLEEQSESKSVLVENGTETEAKSSA